VGDNLHSLTLLGAIREGAAEYPYLHLWGEPGSGKTHLLRGLGSAARARYVDCVGESERALAWDPNIVTWAVDNVESAPERHQLALFNLINNVRAEIGSAIVTASRQAPIQIQVREDLRTRLGWGVVLQIHALNDLQAEQALTAYAHTRGLALPPDVGRYLLTRFRRDMPSLIALINALDVYALERQRLVTLPLVREWLQEDEITRHAS